GLTIPHCGKLAARRRRNSQAGRLCYFEKFSQMPTLSDDYTGVARMRLTANKEDARCCAKIPETTDTIPQSMIGWAARTSHRLIVFNSDTTSLSMTCVNDIIN
ncbi:MAG: hypothetical protein ACXWKH_20885, partial [Limisphaerales bacterium]